MHRKPIFLHILVAPIKLPKVMRYGRTFGLVSVLYAVNIVLGLVRDSVLAANFGATEQLDALLLGMSFVRTIGLDIAMATANVLIPICVPLVLADDKRVLVSFTGRWLKLTLIILTPAIVLLVILSYPLATLLAPGFSESGLLTLSHILSGFAPLLVILGCAGLAKAILDSHKQYAYYPILLGLMSLGLIVGVATGASSWGIQSAVVGVFAGSALGLVLQIGTARRCLERFEWRSFLTPSIFKASPGLSVPLRNVALMLIMSLSLMLHGIVERAYVSKYQPGSLSAYSLALSVVGLPSTLLMPALNSMLLPYLARLETRTREGIQAKNEYGLSVQQYVLLAMGFALITGGLWAGSDIAVRVLFERGRFTSQAAALTAEVVRWLSLSFFSYAMGVVFRQVLIARRLFWCLLAISLIVLVIKVVLLEFLGPFMGFLSVPIQVIITSVLTASLYFGVIKYVRR